MITTLKILAGAAALLVSAATAHADEAQRRLRVAALWPNTLDGLENEMRQETYPF